MKYDALPEKAEEYVDDVLVLKVAGFKHGPHARGNVGLYVDIGTDGWFRNLVITSAD